MPYTQEFRLPTEEELDTPELNMSFVGLKAGAMHFGKACEEESKEFYICRMGEEPGRIDPRHCLKEGKDITNCAINFFRQIKGNCAQEFEQYATCLFMSSAGQSLAACRKTQAVFDKCMEDKLNMERPHFSYYTWVRSHETDRPKPKRPIMVFPGAVPKLPDDQLDKGPPPPYNFPGPL